MFQGRPSALEGRGWLHVPAMTCACCTFAFVSCRSLFPASQWSAEINAAIASAGFFWLVGESELRSEPVEVRQGCCRWPGGRGDAVQELMGGAVQELMGDEGVDCSRVWVSQEGVRWAGV